MKNKSFMLCIAGILVITVMGVYMYQQDNIEEMHSVSSINNNYRIQFVDNYVLPNVEISNDKFIALVPYVEYEQLEESELEDKINATLRDASTNWITDEIVDVYENVLCPTVYCHTSNYLSVGQAYETRGKHSHNIEDYITVDMETGNQVFLDDIVDVDKLCSFLVEGQQYSASRYAFSLDQRDADEGIKAIIKKYSKDEMKNMMKQCSMEQKEFYNWIYESQEGKYPSLQERANFYLQSTQLVIVLEDELHPKVVIKYRDLDGILKEDFKKKMLLTEAANAQDII